MATEREALNTANSSTLSVHLQVTQLGTALAGHVPQQLTGFTALAAKPYELATLQGFGLPYYSRAARIDRAIARTSGNSVTGELSVQAYGTTPLTGQIAVSPSGDVVVLAADQITCVDLYYRPIAGDVMEFTGPVATGILTLPKAITDRGALLLLEAEGLEGSVTGTKIVLVPASAVVATTKAALAIDRSKVYFNHSTDALTSARVKVLVAPKLGLAAALAQEAQTV